jgi:NADH-quinone oxidoreductase subunit B
VSFFSRIGQSIETQLERRILMPWALSFGCCRIEVENAVSATYDWQRLGVGKLVDHPSQADVLLVSGWINEDVTDQLKTIYSQMAGPKSVIALGACALSGSPYALGVGKPKLVGQIIPVDVYVPGCPPRPEAILDAFHMLKKKRNPIKNQEQIIYAALRGPSGN